jgi:hypothetical protein
LTKRTASRALVAALAAALALSGAVAAKDPSAHGKAAAHGGATHTDKVAKPASMTVKGNASHPGGVFRVVAVVHSALADRPATVDAIVHFASGDVSVVLTPSGGGAAYHANVPVPAGEPAGTVLIDATAVVAGVTLTATGSGKIVVEDTTEAPAALASPVESPATCTPDASGAPEASDAPEASAPEASDAPEASGTPDESEAPEASDAPDASSSPNADETSDECDSGDAQGLTLSAETIAKLIAYLESLLTA